MHQMVENRFSKTHVHKIGQTMANQTPPNEEKWGMHPTQNFVRTALLNMHVCMHYLCIYVYVCPRACPHIFIGLICHILACICIILYRQYQSVTARFGIKTCKCTLMSINVLLIGISCQSGLLLCYQYIVAEIICFLTEYKSETAVNLSQRVESVLSQKTVSASAFSFWLGQQTYWNPDIYWRCPNSLLEMSSNLKSKLWNYQVWESGKLLCLT